MKVYLIQEIENRKQSLLNTFKLKYINTIPTQDDIKNFDLLLKNDDIIIKLQKLLNRIYELDTLKDGVPCSHIGCLNHVSHPCENCGRIAGLNENQTR